MFETYFRENLLVITFPRKNEGALVDIFINSQNIFLNIYKQKIAKEIPKKTFLSPNTLLIPDQLQFTLRTFKSILR